METINPPHRVKARKQHMCDWCGKRIEAGEEYTASALKEDDIYTWHACDRCAPYIEECYEWWGARAYDGLSGEMLSEYMWEEHREIAREWWG